MIVGTRAMVQVRRVARAACRAPNFRFLCLRRKQSARATELPIRISQRSRLRSGVCQRTPWTTCSMTWIFVRASRRSQERMCRPQHLWPRSSALLDHRACPFLFDYDLPLLRSRRVRVKSVIDISRTVTNLHVSEGFGKQNKSNVRGRFRCPARGFS